MSTAIVRTLLRAEMQRQQALSRRRVLFAVTLGLANLFFASYAERHLRDDPDGAALLLFLVIEGGALMLLALLHTLTHTGEILSRVRTFPLEPRAIVSFALVASLRRPVFGALTGTAAFALVLLYAAGPGSAVIVLLLTLLFAAGLDLLVLALLVPAIVRPGAGPGIALLIVLLTVIGTIAFAALRGGITFPLPHAAVAAMGLTAAAESPATALGGAMILLLLAAAAPVAARFLLTLGRGTA